MMRRTSPRHALPLIKLLILATRQVTKPFAKMVVSSATEVKAINTLCIAMGRIVLGSTGVLKQESAKQRAALEEKAKAKQRETELIAHVIIEVEDRLKGELDDLRRQLAEAQEAHNALLASLEEKGGTGDPPLGAAAGVSSTSTSNESSLGSAKENQEKIVSEKVPDLNSSAATSCASAPPPHIYVCPMGTYNRPALPTHKTIFGTDNNPPIFPPEPRIETGPFTIPVVAIEVPLGDLAEAIKARGGVGSSGTEEGAVAAPQTQNVSSTGDDGAFSAGTAKTIPPSIDHVQPPQYAVGPSTSTTPSSTENPTRSSVSNDAASSASSSSSTGLPTDADQHFRISAMPTVSVLNASNSSGEATTTQSFTSDSSSPCGSGGLGMTVSGGAASVAVGAPSPSSSASKSIGNERADGSATTTTSTTVGGDSGAHTSSKKKPKGGFNFHKTINQAFHDRYYSRVSDDTLRKAGAEMLVELVAFSILSIILTYEFVMSKKSEQAREKAQLERITALEQKVNEIAATHDSTIAALTVGTSDLDGPGSLFRRVFGGGRRAPTVDDEAQTEEGDSSAKTVSDDSQLDINQRMLRRGLTP